MPLFRLAIAGASAMLVSCALTAVAVSLFSRWGWVAPVRADRWHRGVPCLFGGIPIWVAFAAAALIFVPRTSARIWELLALCTGVFVVGLIDDIFDLRPRRKLLLQILATVSAVAIGVVYPFRESFGVNVFVSAFWILGITNAFNLLDNMDGLSAGVALIAASYLAAIFYANGAIGTVAVLLCFCGAVAGFLVFNFKPAKIFMGDGGSLLLGFTLGTFSLLDITHLSGISTMMAIPVLVMSVPILDTAMVAITRRLRGQPVSQGGTDHTSHRLVRLGLNERRAVLVLYVLAVISGSVALAIRHLPQYTAGIVGFWFLILVLFGVHVFKPETHIDSASVREGFGARFIDRDSIVWILDPLVLSLSYYLAFNVRFFESPDSLLGLWYVSLPALVAFKFLALAVTGVYRRSWWRPGARDTWQIAKACFLGESASVLVFLAFNRFEGFSRLVFALDCFISILLLVLVRQSNASFTRVLDGLRLEPKRQVLVLGTDSYSHLALQYVRSSGMKCMGVMDLDHGSDLGKYVWGMPVLGHWSKFSEVISSHHVETVVVPCNDTFPMDASEFERICKEAGVKVISLGLDSGINAGAQS